MSRSVPWRRTCPDKVSKRIARAARAHIYLLRTTGPTGFLVTAEGDERKFKVFLGDPHSCTCPVFVKERDLCIHILWVLIKKFRVPKENSVIYQLGLVEREIGEVVHGLFSNPESKPAPGKCAEEADTREKLSRKEVSEDDVCPICQEDLLGKMQATTYCRYGCGNSIHIKCMKIWAEHQKSSGETIIKCPLCRVDFGSFEVIKKEYLKTWSDRQKLDVHTGTVCSQCNMAPITGKCYRCNVCPNCQLCKNCFASNCHLDHPFVFRQKPNQRWRAAPKFKAIPTAAANDLQLREITEDDYALLLQLDGSSVSQASVPGHVLNSFPTEQISSNHRLTNDNEKCAVCYLDFKPTQVIRRLPVCKHEFHRHCIDSWLSNDHNTCPIDGQTVYSAFHERQQTGRYRARGVAQSDNQRNSPGNSLAKKRVHLSTTRRQRQTDAEHCFPQDFSLTGLGLNQRSRQRASRLHAVALSRTSSAPISSSTVLQPSQHSSTHITFNSSLPGRAVIASEQILRYGRHSGDSRRRCVGLTSINERKNGLISKAKSLNDITLNGRAISSHNTVEGSVTGSLREITIQNASNLISTSIAAPTSGSAQIQVDI